MRTVRYAIVRTLAAAIALVVPVLFGVTPAYAASWQIVASPNPTGNDGFSTLTAISASNLWAVGSATSLSSSSATLIAHYTGTSWQVVPSPNPAGGRYDNLTGVSATSASDIWSVGMEFVNSSHSFPIIEHYNGSAWSLVTSAQPTQVGDLEAVAALTPANVWAVGNGHTDFKSIVQALKQIQYRHYLTLEPVPREADLTNISNPFSAAGSEAAMDSYAEQSISLLRLYERLT